jgi:hypothetical protein
VAKRSVRRASLVLLLAAVAGTASACAGSAVSGHGVLADAPAPTGSGGFPSVAVPSPSIAAPSPAANSAAVNGGVAVIDRGGHFRVRMPSAPQKLTEPGSFGGYEFHVHVDIVRSPYVAIVEGEDVTPALTRDSFEITLRSAVSSFQTSSGMTLIKESRTTFQGHRGRKAILERAGTRYEFLIFIYSGSQVYALLAPAGAKFAALANSFVAMP